MLPGLDGLKLRRNPENCPINNVCPSPAATHKTQVKMILLSNQHRDELIRYLDMLIEICSDDRNSRVQNAVRRAKILKRELEKKQSFSRRKEKELKKLTLF
jgi:hypothetical protein